MFYCLAQPLFPFPYVDSLMVFQLVSLFRPYVDSLCIVSLRKEKKCSALNPDIVNSQLVAHESRGMLHSILKLLYKNKVNNIVP
jgi:hypothetical protein